MTTQPAPFVAPSRNGDAWFFAGHTSSFPNLTEPGTDVLCEPRPCKNGNSVPGCKVFHIPSGDISQVYEVEVDGELTTYQDQVLIFQYKGKIYAIDNVNSFGPLEDNKMLNYHAEMPTFSVSVGQYD
ncbi:hypothetical protein F5B17DRAFT_430784 [Nemania serpens]|nr:hypothetical protein F5B17DRAFT_430784 [Nemania serpens]